MDDQRITNAGIVRNLRAPKEDKKLEAQSNVLANRVEFIFDRMDLAEIVMLVHDFNKRDSSLLVTQVVDAAVRTRLERLNKALADANAKDATPAKPPQKP